jgi:histidyl-tRNA synthetase
MLVRRLTASAERYGFPFWETPTIEALEALLGGGESEAVKQIFYVRSPDDGQMDLGLRFDLTIPFARVAAGLIRGGHPLPLRRAETGLVYRADKPGIGRTRQFTQFDIDILGSPSPWAELEILSMLYSALGEHSTVLPPMPGLSIYTKVSSRRLLDAVLDAVGIDEQRLRLAVIRVIDKMEKLEPREVLLELTVGRKDESGADIPGVGLPSVTADQVLERIVNLRSHPSREDSLNAAAQYVKSVQGEQAIQELAEFSDALDLVGLSDRDVEFDFSLARGLDYYTGLVFEVRNRSDDRMSIAAGGRYDDLLSRFSDVSMSGTGISVGIDRLAELLLAEGAEVATASLPERKILLGLPGVQPAALQVVANKIRSGGVDIQLHIPEPGTPLRKQLAYANRGDYAFALLVGPEELRDGTVSVKNLRQDSRTEAELSHEEYRALGTKGQRTLSLDDAIGFLATR